jgi:hypothetical protein
MHVHKKNTFRNLKNDKKKKKGRLATERTRHENSHAKSVSNKKIESIYSKENSQI